MALHATELRPAAMTYPGNPSLAAEVRARILATFRQSVEAAARGDRDQALLGCDFIRRLDPDFDLARSLQEMLESGRSAESFLGLLDALPSTVEPAEASVAADVGPAAMPLASSSPGLAATFTKLLNARRFADLLAAAQAQAAAVSGDAKLRQLVETAQSRYEAEPFVRDLIDNARRALGSGQLDQIEGLLEKVRSLDPSHPGLAEIDRLRSSATTPAETSLRIDWDDERPAPTQVRPPSLAAESHEWSAVERQTARSPQAGPNATLPPELAPAPDLDLPEIDFSVGELPDLGSERGAAFADEGDSLEAAPADGGDSESGERVQALLDEGQRAFERSEYQGAIDSWSRIFLIDIDNQEAAQRIERARQLKAEQEREIEEVFHAGVARFDGGDWEGAREAFRRVLDEQPSYVLAREYLEKIDEREAEGGDTRPGLELPELAPLIDAGPQPAPASEARLPKEEILIPPDPGSNREARKPAVDGFAVKARRSILPSGRFLAIGGAVLALLAIGGWFLSSRWESLFPNSRPTPPATSVLGPIAQAKKLQGEGKTAVAIAALRRIPPQDAAYAEAQSLISQWEKLTAPKEEPAAAPTAEQVRRQELLTRAASALEREENYRARQLFDEAAAISPLEDRWAEQRSTADRRLADLAQELTLMRDSEYEMALNRLWRRHEADPANRDTRQLMVDAYYNLSVADLRRGDPRAARAKLRDALEIDRSDPFLVRLERFCAAYERRGQDLLYRIFVKYLPAR